MHPLQHRKKVHHPEKAAVRLVGRILAAIVSATQNVNEEVSFNGSGIWQPKLPSCGQVHNHQRGMENRGQAVAAEK